MKLVVAYLATTGGEDAIAVAVRLARTLGAQLDICMVLPPDRALPGLVPGEGYQDMLDGKNIRGVIRYTDDDR